MSQPLGCLANLSNRELVDAALEAAEWAEALELARESDLAALASFWAASLHTAMARRACNDAQQVVDLGENFPEFRLVPFQLMQPEQERMREDFEACQQTFHRATMNDMARREWIQEFANQSLKHAETCVWMGWSVLLRRTMQDVRITRFECMLVPERCQKLKVRLDVAACTQTRAVHLGNTGVYTHD